MNMKVSTYTRTYVKCNFTDEDKAVLEKASNIIHELYKNRETEFLIDMYFDRKFESDDTMHYLDRIMNRFLAICKEELFNKDEIVF